MPNGYKNPVIVDSQLHNTYKKRERKRKRDRENLLT